MSNRPYFDGGEVSGVWEEVMMQHDDMSPAPVCHGGTISTSPHHLAMTPSIQERVVATDILPLIS